MPANVGGQDVSLMYYTVANANEVNARFRDTRKIGIYKGGYLSKVDDTHVQLSPLVCEITDGTYQVKVETTEVVGKIVSLSIPYVVLRWVYTGSTADYMEILSVASPTTYDLVVGRCTFSGTILTGFTYDERNTPSTYDLFLKVEPTESSELRVRVRAGRIQVVSGVTNIPDQKSNLFSVPGNPNSRIDLVYVTNTGAIEIDNSGTPAVNPTPPSYKGKMVLAEVTIAYNSTNITSSMIKDVRSFISPPNEPDNTSLEKGSDGTWRVKGSGVVTGEGEVANGANFTVYCGTKGEVLVKLYMMFRAEYGSFGISYAQLRTSGGGSILKERWGQMFEWDNRRSSVVVPVVKKFTGYSPNQAVTFNAYTPQGAWVKWIDYEYIGT